jgi:DUF4097 and DUF4098 domain-containing protein YvlB
MFNFKGDVNIKSTKGQITVYMNLSLDTDIEMKTTNGIVSVKDIALNFTKTEGTHMEGVLGNGGNKKSIENTNGNVNVYSLQVDE